MGPARSESRKKVREEIFDRRPGGGRPSTDAFMAVELRGPTRSDSPRRDRSAARAGHPDVVRFLIDGEAYLRPQGRRLTES